METMMSKHDEKLEQKSPAKPEINALDDNDLAKVTGGDVVLRHEKVTGADAGRASSSELRISKVMDKS
jgi:hypothetical protein